MYMEELRGMKRFCEMKGWDRKKENLLKGGIFEMKESTLTEGE